MSWAIKQGRSQDQSISTLPAPAEESPQVSEDWNSGELAHPARGLCLHELIEEQARQTPGQIALVFEQQSLTYGVLNDRANQLARHLGTLGAGPEVLVGLFVERSVEMIAGILGILKAGGAYLPIDTAFPPDRIEFMLADAGIKILLTQKNLLEALPGGAVQTICLDSFDWTRSEAGMEMKVRVRPENLAYVIYTSGSTGRPKGVCIEHRNIVNYVLGIVQRLRLKPGMSYALVSSIAADLGNTVIFPALSTGGRLHIIAQARAENGALLADYFSRENIDVLKIVPSHLAALQAARNPKQVLPRARLILGGEASRLQWIDGLRRLAPDCEIYNHYGPTETTVGVLTYHAGAQWPSTQSGTLPLGQPLPNSRIYILDEHGEPVPMGQTGQLCIAGEGVGRGYLNRSELTVEKFVADPFSPAPGGRLYRTGDLARCLPDGNIEFCGRIDHQVKINGYRVELGEIEQALREQDGVRGALAAANEDEFGNKRLIAYVVPQRPDQPLWKSNALYVLPDGSPVAHLNRNETEYIYNEIFVLQAYLRHGIAIHDGDCILDVGSNIGLFTVFVSRLARNLRVLSFEPNPAALECLKANAEAWGAAVKCLPFGLSNENKSADLTFFEGLSLFSGFYADADAEREVVSNYVLNRESDSLNRAQLAEVGKLIEDRLQSRIVPAQLRTLSSVIAQEGIERIDLLKINVEKSELDVLLGIRPGDWPKIRQVVLEVDLEEHLEPITALLRRHGFEIFIEQDPLLKGTALRYVYAIRPSAMEQRLLPQPADSRVSLRPSAEQNILTPATLRKQLKDRLPHYMIPSAFVLLEKFPLTTNGKIDRQALFATSHQSAQPTRDFSRPQTETETALTALWTELLRVENIGAGDDFFDLGGDSLLAMRAILQIRDKFGIDLQLRNLFEQPTIAGLAEVIDALSWSAKSSNRNSSEREEISL